MSFYSVEQWTIRDVANAFKETSGDISNRRVIIPIFQRGKRWQKKKKEAFIDSLNKGYPFGSLLFAKQEAPNTYSVVDGLQRGSTVCDYVYNPLTKENISEIDEEVLNSVRLVLFPGSLNLSINEKIKEIILEYFDEKKSFNNVDTSDLSLKILEQIPTAETNQLSCLFAIKNALKPLFDSIKEKYDRICSAVVPIIVYSGEPSLLNVVFQRINKQGEPLTDYEIYAAIWSQERRTINSEDVVQSAVNKYIAVTKEGYEIEDFDATQMLSTKQLTAFEYLFGLGKYWSKTFEILRFEKEERDDKVNEIGFEIIDACISDSRDISNLGSKIYTYNINKLQRRIEEAIRFVSDAISEVSKFKGNSRVLKILHSKYQIISLVSFTFRQMYEISNLESKRHSWNNVSEDYRHKILAHYVADIITNEWHDGGAGKVYSTTREERYLESISKQRWSSILDNYYQTQLSNGQTSRFSNPTNADSVILNCIYVNIFSARDHLSTQMYDIEHIATKEKMRLLIKKCNEIKLPVSCIANLCYLPENINRGKKEKTIYEASGLSLPIFEIEQKFTFTKEKDMNWIFYNYQESDSELLKNNYIDFLNARYSLIKEKFLQMFYN